MPTVTVGMYNEAAQRTDRVPVPEEVLQDLVRMVFEEVAFKSFARTGLFEGDPHRLRVRFHRWQSALREAQQALEAQHARQAAPDAPATEAWVPRAIARRAEGVSWSQLEKELGVSRRTLRRYVPDGAASAAA